MARPLALLAGLLGALALVPSAAGGIGFGVTDDGSKYAAAIRTDIADGTKVGVTGTPAFFINGRFFSGNLPYQDIQAVIEDELQRIGAKK